MPNINLTIEDVLLEVEYETYSVEGVRNRKEIYVDVLDVFVGGVSILNFLTRDKDTIEEIQKIIKQSIIESYTDRMIESLIWERESNV